MGLVRPELAKELRRWAEPMGAVALAGLGLGMFWHGLARYNLIWQGLGAILGLLGLAAFVASYRRVRFAQGDGGPGLVEVTERRITYLTFVGGGALDLESLIRLEYRSHHSQGAVWVLTGFDDTILTIPVNAAGAAQLFDAFAALRGIDMVRLLRAGRLEPGHSSVIWQREPGFPALTNPAKPDPLGP